MGAGKEGPKQKTFFPGEEGTKLFAKSWNEKERKKDRKKESRSSELYGRTISLL